MADYPTLGAALAALPSPLTQAYDVQLLDAAYTENVVLSLTGTNANTLTIHPATGVTTVITGTLTFGAGAAYVTVSGDNGGLGRALTLRQPGLVAPTVVFGGDAAHNAVRQAVILGSNTLWTSGVVVLGDGTVNGNDANALTDNRIANDDPGLLPANLVYAVNLGGGMNDDFTFSHNELANFGKAGVLVGAGNGDAWTISNNSFYYDAIAVPTTAQTAIDFGPGSGANDATVSDNAIGGRAAGGSGGVWVNAGSQGFRGIVMDCGSSIALSNVVTGNTVSAISLTGFGSGALTAVDVDGGRSELSGNTMWGVTNAGTSGVNSLVSSATTILADFTVASGQLMVVADGQTIVMGNLSNAGILNHTGGDVIIHGNFTNTGTFAQTLGDLEVMGDMNNTGQFTCSTGTVRLTGTGAQSVSGGLYFNLEVSGPGTKTLTDDVTVFNGVQMLNGILNTGSSKLTLGVLANLTESNTSYVLGRVEAKRTPVAGTTQDFGGLGLAIHPAIGATLPGLTTVSRITGVAPVGVAGHQGILRYFDVTAPVNTGLNMTLTMTYLTHELNSIAPANLRFFNSTDNGVTWQNKHLTSAAPGALTLTGATTLGRWTLGDAQAPLPVELTSFVAARQGTAAVLSWTTASERNTVGFGIEVSTDGKPFRRLGWVEGAGSSNAPRSYKFVDNEPGKAGPRYYRLRQDDTDRATHYFGTKVLDFDSPAPALVVYPTRFGEEMTVTLLGNRAADLTLLDNVGRVVWSQPGLAAGGPAQALRPGCAAGSYVLTATIGNTVLRQRVVKE